MKKQVPICIWAVRNEKISHRTVRLFTEQRPVLPRLNHGAAVVAHSIRYVTPAKAIAARARVRATVSRRCLHQAGAVPGFDLRSPPPGRRHHRHGIQRRKSREVVPLERTVLLGAARPVVGAIERRRPPAGARLPHFCTVSRSTEPTCLGWRLSLRRTHTAGRKAR